MLTDAPIGACREAGDYMLIRLVDDTLPPEWKVPATPAVVKKALATITAATITKPTAHTPMGWTEVTTEAVAAGHVAKVMGK